MNRKEQKQIIDYCYVISTKDLRFIPKKIGNTIDLKVVSSDCTLIGSFYRYNECENYIKETYKAIK